MYHAGLTCIGQIQAALTSRPDGWDESCDMLDAKLQLCDLRISQVFCNMFGRMAHVFLNTFAAKNFFTVGCNKIDYHLLNLRDSKNFYFNLSYKV